MARVRLGGAPGRWIPLGLGDSHLLTRTLLVLLPLFLVIMSASPTAGQESGREGGDEPPEPDLIQVIPQSTVLQLSDMVDGQGESFEHPPAYQGVLLFSVLSPLPDWGVATDLGPLGGPQGPIPDGRIWASLPGAPDEFLPFSGEMVIAVGQGPEPSYDLPLTLEVRPEWSDCPGSYQGTLTLLPFAGTATPGGEPPSEPSLYGPPVPISIEVELLEFTMVGTVSDNFILHASAGSGRFEVVPDMEMVVATNSPSWEVRIYGSSFTCAGYEIPLGRLLWGVVGPGGDPESWTALGEDSVLLSGTGIRGVFTEVYRFAMDITMSDHAGDYQANLQLVGTGGP